MIAWCASWNRWTPGGFSLGVDRVRQFARCGFDPLYELLRIESADRVFNDEQSRFNFSRARLCENERAKGFRRDDIAGNAAFF